MKQYFAPYYNWEDFKNGMYEIPKEESRTMEIEKSVLLLSDSDSFNVLCETVLREWKISSMVNLTNTSCNRRAWLGQASCNYKYKVTETSTRMAWAELSEEKQIYANEIATKWIKIFESNYEREIRKIYPRVGRQMLLRWDS